MIGVPTNGELHSFAYTCTYTGTQSLIEIDSDAKTIAIDEKEEEEEVVAKSEESAEGCTLLPL